MRRLILSTSELITLFTVLTMVLYAFPAFGANFTSGTATAKKFGVHEISLTGNGSASNPFDTECKVTFTNGSSSYTVDAFYDGGNIWRARCYITKAGVWNWSSSSSGDSGLNDKSGLFTAENSTLRGMLKTHSQNSKMWMTDNGKTFINVADTPYRMFSHQSFADDYQQFVADDENMGVSFMRCLLLGEWDWGLYWSDGDEATGPRERPSLTDFRRADMRLGWIIDNHPNMYIQLILFPDGEWSKLADDTFWQSLSSNVRTKMMRYIIARFGAFPNILWEVTNDTGIESQGQTPGKWFWATDVGNYFKNNDPWGHFMAYGHARDDTYPFCNHSWSTYIVAYTGYDLACAFPYDKNYDTYNKHVYNTEDYYETYHPPANPKYFYRRLMWAYLLSGMSATYAGDWADIIPYSSSNNEGLDSIPHIVSFFNSNNIDLAYFTPDDGIVEQINAPSPEGNNGPSRSQCTRRGYDEFIVYIPNATDGERAGYTPNGTNSNEESRANAALAVNKTPQMRVNLNSASGTFSVNWYRAKDGILQNGGSVDGGAWRTLTSPWEGCDTVLYLKSDSVQPQILVPQTDWTLKFVDSEELVGESGVAVNAFDGHTNTIWHTRWHDINDPQPHEIQIDLGDYYDLTGLRYLPRQDGDNGRIKDYEFYASADGNNWNLVSSGTFTDNANEQEIVFEKQESVKYIKLKTLSAYDNDSWSTIAEINLLGVLGAPVCSESWSCADWSTWSTCVSDTQSRTRTCTDQNNCGTTISKPDETETQFCESPIIYGISNFINLVTDWLKPEPPDLESDVNNDGVVNTRDLGIMMSNWGE